MTSLPGGVDYTVVLVPASAAADAGAFPQGSFVLPPGTTLSAPPALPPPPHLGVDPAAGLPYGGLGPLPAGAFGQSTAEADAEAFAAHGLLAPFGPEGADGFYGPLDTAQFAAAAGLLQPEAPQEEPLPLPPQQLLPLIRPRACPCRAACVALSLHALTCCACSAAAPQAARQGKLRARCAGSSGLTRGPCACFEACGACADVSARFAARRRRALRVRHAQRG